jgi:hypothetical protein
MSIRVISNVWEHSQHKGMALLILLAIADNAQDDGYCWPSIEHLAGKARVSSSSVIRSTKALEDSRELFVVHNRRHGNRYIVRLGLTDEQFAESMNRNVAFLRGNRELLDYAVANNALPPAVQEEAEEQDPDMLQDDMCQPATSEVSPCHIRTVTAMEYQPSVTVNEPSILPPRRCRTPEDIRSGIQQAVKNFEERQERDPVDGDWRTVPIQQGQILTEFYRQSELAVPQTKPRRQQATAAAERMYQEVGSAEEVRRRIRSLFRSRQAGDPALQFTIHGPWSVVETVINWCPNQEPAGGVIRVGS